VSVHADLLIYLAVVAALWAIYMIRKHRRQASKPRLGDADAYEGNLVIPSPGHEQPGRHGFHSPHTSDHIVPGIGHSGHVGGHDAGGGHH
jgi:hypothetical protein